MRSWLTLAINKRAVLTTAFVALCLTFLGKGLAFGKEVVLSFYFGANDSTDAYFIANAVPGVMWATIYVTINTVFLPAYVEASAKKGGRGAKLAVEAVQAYFALALLATVACVFAAGTIVRWTAPDAPFETVALAETLTIIMSGGFVFSGYVAVQNAVQQAHGIYQSPLVVPVINNLLAIVGIIIAAYFADIRIAVSMAVFAWVIQAPIQRIQTRRFYQSVGHWVVQSATMQRLALLSAPVMLGTFLDQINIYVGLYLASGFDKGVISHLNYANRLALFLASTFPMLVAYFLFPRLAADAALNEDSRTRQTLTRGMVLVVVSTLPLVAFAAVLRADIIALIYGRGAFHASDVAATAAAFAAYAYGIIFIGMREIFNRLFYSYQRNAIPLVIGIVAALSNFIASWWLLQNFGAVGIGLGASVAAMTYFAGQICAVIVWKPDLIDRKLVRWVGIAFVAIVPALPLLLLSTSLLVQAPAILRIAACGAIFFPGYCAVFFLLARPAGLSLHDLSR